MLTLLATAAGTTKTVDVEYIQGKPEYDKQGITINQTPRSTSWSACSSLRDRSRELPRG